MSRDCDSIRLRHSSCLLVASRLFEVAPFHRGQIGFVRRRYFRLADGVSCPVGRALRHDFALLQGEELGGRRKLGTLREDWISEVEHLRSKDRKMPGNED